MSALEYVRRGVCPPWVFEKSTTDMVHIPVLRVPMRLLSDSVNGGNGYPVQVPLTEALGRWGV